MADTAPTPVEAPEVKPASRIEFEVVDEHVAPPPAEPDAPVTPEDETVVLPPVEAEAAAPAPIVVAPAVTPEELADLRAAKEQRDNFARMLDDQEVYIPYLKKMKADGLKRDPNFKLIPEHEALIAPKQAGPTRQQVIAKIKELKEVGDYEQAYQIEEQYITRPAAQAAANAVLEEREKRSASEAQRVQAETNYRSEWEGLQKSYPELVVKDAQYQAGYQVKDAAVLKKMLEIQKTDAPGATLQALMKLALVDLGRWGGNQTPPRTQKTSTAQVSKQLVVGPKTPKGSRITYDVVDARYS